MLQINDKAQEFALKNKDGRFHLLKNISAEYIILYFYPKDDTPGCTIEAKEFTNDLNKFEKLNVKIIGISGGDETTKKKFCDKYNLKILLLSDPDFSVCKKYGVYGEKSFMGKKFMGINRTTFVIDKNKKIVKVYEDVKPEDHSKEILEFIKNEKS